MFSVFCPWLTAKFMTGKAVVLATLFLGKPLSADYQYLVHLSPLNDNGSRGIACKIFSRPDLHTKRIMPHLRIHCNLDMLPIELSQLVANQICDLQPTYENKASGFPTRSDTNRPVQPQDRA